MKKKLKKRPLEGRNAASVDDSAAALGGRDALLYSELLEEKKMQQQTMDMCDSSLHGSCGIVVAALSLSVPALITTNQSLGEVEEKLPVISFLACTAIIIVVLFMLLLVRARNTSMSYMTYLSNSMNAIVRRNYGEEFQILYQPVGPMSKFYYGADNGWRWVAMYVFVSILLAAGFAFSIYLNWENAAITMILFFEVAGLLFCVYVALVSRGSKRMPKKIRDDYARWLSSVAGTASFPSGLDMEDFIDPGAYES